MKITAWEKLGISNDFIFGKVMQNPDICKEFLEMVLNIKIDHIEYPVVEKTMKLSYDSKGIRLDVYVKDDKHTVYNIELQAIDTHELPARSRYYQGIIDMELLQKGQSYNQLNKSYIIFVCKFDLFKMGRYCYTFEHRCVEDPNIRLDDGTTRIFLNTKGNRQDDDMNKKMQEFLAYVDGTSCEGDFVRKLEQAVIEVKQNSEFRREYMNLVVQKQISLNEGFQLGIEHGLIVQISKKLKKSKTLEEIAYELECSPGEIRKLYDIVKQYEPDYSVDEIMKRLNTL